MRYKNKVLHEYPEAGRFQTIRMAVPFFFFMGSNKCVVKKIAEVDLLYFKMHEDRNEWILASDKFHISFFGQYGFRKAYSKEYDADMTHVCQHAFPYLKEHEIPFTLVYNNYVHLNLQYQKKFIITPNILEVVVKDTEVNLRKYKIYELLNTLE